MAPSLESDTSQRPQETTYRFTRPDPRPPRSHAEIAAIRVKNRRREYLERNPGYFRSADHEFADPLLYDDLVRRFQTPAEREADGKAKGYGRVLEGSLLRGEARLAQISPADDAQAGASTRPDPALVSALRVTAAEADNVAVLPPPKDREEATERWQEFLRNRFIRGGDEEFEYGMVDGNEEYDVLERREEEEAWFEDEDPNWASLAEGDDRDTPQEEEGRAVGREMGPEPERMLQGETGIQDY